MEPKPKSGVRRFFKGLFSIVILLGVFSFGVGVGDGSISFQRHESQNKQLPENLDYSEVETVYDSLKVNYNGKLTQEQLINGLKHGLAEATNDPYTSYFTPKEAREFEEQINNHFSGIGAQLGQDKEGNLEVIAPIEDLPADKAGLKA
jgi:carboxyl-terminal processing protease